jgi:hypothetical protein
MTVSEKIFQDQVIKIARMQQWLVFHASPSSPRPGVWRSDGNGFPDLVLVSTSVPSRGVIFCELKTADGKLSAEQEKYARCLINAGIEYHLLASTRPRRHRSATRQTRQSPMRQQVANHPQRRRNAHSSVTEQWKEHCPAKSTTTFHAPKTGQNTMNSTGGNQTSSEQ